MHRESGRSSAWHELQQASGRLAAEQEHISRRVSWPGVKRRNSEKCNTACTRAAQADNVWPQDGKQPEQSCTTSRPHSVCTNQTGMAIPLSPTLVLSNVTGSCSTQPAASAKISMVASAILAPTRSHHMKGVTMPTQTDSGRSQALTSSHCGPGRAACRDHKHAQH